ncbi:MAG: roadblock/LC7 domain-containing protein [ANME-2 cluster archaeon]|nr:roadblock/LC7 domain-containing protein [ANME-2 cluster archaeon]
MKNIGGIEACAIVSRDGLLMSSDMPDGIMGETFAAMSATMLGAAETATT